MKNWRYQGGAGNNLFSLDGWNGELTVDGGTGSDTLRYTQAADIAWTLWGTNQGEVAGIDFTNMENLAGGSGVDTLYGPGAATVAWQIDGPGSGQVTGMAFSGMENLIGAADNQDRFTFAANGSLAGSVAGGGGGFDTVVLGGGSFNRVVYSASGADAGSIQRDEDVLHYSGMEPVVDNSNTADRVFTGTSIADTIRLWRNAPGQLTIESDNDLATFESITFGDPSGSLTIDTGFSAVGSEEKVTIDNLGDLNADLSIVGDTAADGTDKVIFQGKTHLLGHDLEVGADLIQVEDNAEISTRLTASADHRLGDSTGNSGQIVFDAQDISLEQGSALLAQVQTGSSFTAGRVELKAEISDYSATLPIDVIPFTGNVSISLDGATVLGGEISLEATKHSEILALGNLRPFGVNFKTATVALNNSQITGSQVSIATAAQDHNLLNVVPGVATNLTIGPLAELLKGLFPIPIAFQIRSAEATTRLTDSQVVSAGDVKISAVTAVDSTASALAAVSRFSQTSAAPEANGLLVSTLNSKSTTKSATISRQIAPNQHTLYAL